MDTERRKAEERSLKKAFKGSLLVSSLLEQYKDRFTERAQAEKFGQHLLDQGHIESIIGSSKFLDSVTLYRWTDKAMVKGSKMRDFPNEEYNDNDSSPREQSEGTSSGDSESPPPAAASPQPFKVPQSVPKRADFTQDKASTWVRRRKPKIEKYDFTRRQTVHGIYSPEHIRSVTQQVHATLEQGGSLSDLARTTSTSSEIIYQRGHSNSEVSLARNNAPSISDMILVTRSRSRRSISPPPRPVLPGTPPYPGRLSQHGSTGNLQARARAARSPWRKSDADLPVPDVDYVQFVSAAPVNGNFRANRVEEDGNSKEVEGYMASNSDFHQRGHFGTTQSLRQKKKPTVNYMRQPKWSSVDNVSTAVSNGVLENKLQRAKALAPAGLPQWGSIESVASDPQGRPPVGRSQSATPRYRVGPAVMTSSQAGRDEEDVASILSVDEISTSSYSDNEKYLLERMRQMKSQHDAVVASYESRISELMSKMHELRGIADILEHAGRGSRSVTPPSHGSSEADKDSPGTREKGNGTRRVLPTPPPKPTMTAHGSRGRPDQAREDVQDRPDQAGDAAVTSDKRSSPRTLLWSTLYFNSDDTQDTVWKAPPPPNVNAKEFDRLFGAQEGSVNGIALYDVWRAKCAKATNQPRPVLPPERSRAVVTCLRRLPCSMEDVTKALYDFDLRHLELDRLTEIYQVRASTEELNQIKNLVHQKGQDCLDLPERFLLNLSLISQFEERIECLQFQQKFYRTMFLIEQRLSVVKSASEELRNSKAVQRLLGLILAIGTHMNRSTARGRASGFQLSLLQQLKSVTSVRTEVNLHQYIIRKYIEEYAVEHKHTACPFPSPPVMQRAAQVSFIQIESDLGSMAAQLRLHKNKVERVQDSSRPSVATTFKHKMADFFTNGDAIKKRQMENYEQTTSVYRQLLTYFGHQADDEENPEHFFSMWATFLAESEAYWREEQCSRAMLYFDSGNAHSHEKSKPMRGRQTPVFNLTKSVLMTRSMSVNSLDLIEEERMENGGTGLNIAPVQQPFKRYESLRTRLKHGPGDSIKARMKKLASNFQKSTKKEDLMRKQGKLHKANGAVKANGVKRVIVGEPDTNGSEHYPTSDDGDNPEQDMNEPYYLSGTEYYTNKRNIRRSQSLRQQFPDMERTVDRLRQGESLTDLTNDAGMNHGYQRPAWGTQKRDVSTNGITYR